MYIVQCAQCTICNVIIELNLKTTTFHVETQIKIIFATQRFFLFTFNYLMNFRSIRKSITFSLLITRLKIIYKENEIETKKYYHNNGNKTKVEGNQSTSVVSRTKKQIYDTKWNLK